MLKDLVKLLENLKSIKPYTLTLILSIGVLYLFKDDVSHLFKVKILNQDRIVNQLQGDVLVNNSLKALLAETNADRAYVFRFHNGDAYYNGTHKNKFSCDYEVVKPGISTQATNLQNIPVTLYPEFINTVINNELYYADVDTIENIVLRVTLKEQGIKQIAVAPYFRNDKLFAMIGVDYLNTYKDGKFAGNLESKVAFAEKVRYIGNLLK